VIFAISTIERARMAFRHLKLDERNHSFDTTRF
jgi:hypothetical protein